MIFYGAARQPLISAKARGMRMARVHPSLTCARTAATLWHYHINRESLVRIILGSVVAGLGVDMFTIGYIVRGNGKKKLEGIMGQYNIDKQKVTFHLSPSLMRCKLPQDQTALGMTFSIGF